MLKERDTYGQLFLIVIRVHPEVQKAELRLEDFHFGHPIALGQLNS